MYMSALFKIKFNMYKVDIIYDIKLDRRFKIVYYIPDDKEASVKLQKSLEQ